MVTLSTKPIASIATRSARPAAGWIALGAVAGPILFSLRWVAPGFISPRHTMWGLSIPPPFPPNQPLWGAGAGPAWSFINPPLIPSGLLMVCGAVGIFRSIGGLGRAARWIGTGLLALPGLGAVIDGVFTLEHFFFHFVGFGLALTAVVGFPVAGLLLRRVPSWRRFGSWLIAAGPLTLALTVLYFATFTPTIEGVQHGVAGLIERILVLELQAWYVAIGWLAFNKSRGDSAVA